jgi:hypothetical protein
MPLNALGGRGPCLATAQHVVEQQHGEVPLPQRLLCRIRYFTDGVILGSQSFVKFCRVTLWQAQAKARLQAPQSCHAVSVFMWHGGRFAEGISDPEKAGRVHFWVHCLTRLRISQEFPDKAKNSREHMGVPYGTQDPSYTVATRATAVTFFPDFQPDLQR